MMNERTKNTIFFYEVYKKYAIAHDWSISDVSEPRALSKLISLGKDILSNTIYTCRYTQNYKKFTPRTDYTKHKKPTPRASPLFVTHTLTHACVCVWSTNEHKRASFDDDENKKETKRFFSRFITKDLPVNIYTHCVSTHLHFSRERILAKKIIFKTKKATHVNW